MRVLRRAQNSKGSTHVHSPGGCPPRGWIASARRSHGEEARRSYIQNYGDRFRFNTLQTRFSKFVDLWDRGLRAREEGRPGPFGRKPADAPRAPSKPEDKVLLVASFKDPLKEMEKLHDLYDTLRDARDRLGEQNIPFHKFTELVKAQVSKLKKDGSAEVAFRLW